MTTVCLAGWGASPPEYAGPWGSCCSPALRDAVGSVDLVCSYAGFLEPLAPHLLEPEATLRPFIRGQGLKHFVEEILQFLSEFPMAEDIELVPPDAKAVIFAAGKLRCVSPAPLDRSV